MRTRPLLTAILLLALTAPVATAAVRTARTAAAAKARSKASEWHPVVPFIEDDFGRALALAKERKRPVFIEGWAPW